ncbi:MAG: tRNA (adenosine(37)-N6)-dimethylallyltransferase MiaA [Candidatus Hydrogenedentes bacterium]|nr:tRNA (adenosine(37)-N6)-dimethylallyltransferase MiaA [Candidatus Hydrogenedentota bacterium]
MSADSGRPRIVAVVGPTGSGKTALAIGLAERLGSEILSVDSMQCYRGMEIGTAAPTLEERTRVPHHLVSIIDPDESMNAGDFEARARSIAEQLHAQGRVPVAAGGSGLYVSALLDGIFDGPGRDEHVRARLRAEAREEGNEALFARLRAVDPAYAAQLTSSNDSVRVVRALEVFECSGRPFSELHAAHQALLEPLESVQFALHYPDREVLYARINARVDAMIAAGWVTEVQRLLDLGYGPQIDRLKALGYREIASALHGEQPLETAIEATKLHHRRYAKRQLTWFRNDPRVQWIDTTIHPTPVSQLDAVWRQIPESWRVRE